MIVLSLILNFEMSIIYYAFQLGIIQVLGPNGEQQTQTIKAKIKKVGCSYYTNQYYSLCQSVMLKNYGYRRYETGDINNNYEL